MKQMRVWRSNNKSGSEPRLGKLVSRSFACFCCTQQCGMNDYGHGCVRCTTNGSPTYGFNDDAPSGEDLVCVCPTCTCPCAITFEASDRTQIALATEAEKRKKQQVTAAGNHSVAEQQSIFGGILKDSIQSSLGVTSSTEQRAVEVGISTAFCNPMMGQLRSLQKASRREIGLLSTKLADGTDISQHRAMTSHRYH